MRYINIKEREYVKNNGDILACKYYHNMFKEGLEAIGDCGAEEVDSKYWDIFHISYETEDAYYGIPMLGIGLVNCMILKKDTRPFLPSEISHTYDINMYGSNTCKFIKGYNLQIEPIVNKLN